MKLNGSKSYQLILVSQFLARWNLKKATGEKPSGSSLDLGVFFFFSDLNCTPSYTLNMKVAGSMVLIYKQFKV